MNRVRSSSGLWLLILGGALALIASLGGCSLSSSADCTADTDCPAKHECVSGGGLLISGGGVCVERIDSTPDGDSYDAARDAEEDTEMLDTTDGGASDASQDADVSDTLNTDLSDADGGWDFSCGLKPNGTVECWGSDTDGRSTPPSGW